MKHFFKGGFIRFSKNDQVWKYEVRNIEDINDKIIPYFDKNKLKTSKVNDFEKFKRSCHLIKSNRHLSYEGIKEIIEIAYSMNISGKKKYLKDFLLRLLDKVKI